MTHRTLVNAATLAAHLEDPNWRVIDCRFELGQSDAGRAAYERGHLRGAHYAHLDTDLSGARTPWTGRHPLPDPAALVSTLRTWGIDPGTQVVAYDDSGGIYAARLWWLLRCLGHEAVAVLDGGLNAWRATRLPIEDTSTPRAASGRFTGTAAANGEVDADQVAALLQQRACLLLDARAPERFEGRVEPLDPRAGHIPGATHHHYARNLGIDGCFLPAAALRARFLELLADRTPDALISMCGSGVTACHTLLALEIAALPGARLYAGSWSEWCRDAARPVASGP